MDDIRKMKKGDLRKIWIILAVLLKKKHQTAIDISRITGIPRVTVIDILTKIMSGQIPKMVIEKDDSTYSIKEWGGFLTKGEVLRYYKSKIVDKKSDGIA